MCKYAMALYKSHYACFDCKKTFKRRLMWDINRDDKRTVEAVSYTHLDVYKRQVLGNKI